MDWRKSDLSKIRRLVGRFRDLSTLAYTTLGQSRQFAFAQFATIADATRLLERHYPSLPLENPHDRSQQEPSQPVRVRIAYSRDRDDREKAGHGEDDWKCDVVCVMYTVKRK